MRIIETTHLKTWAGSKAAESRFPGLVKSLICAVIRPDKIHFPSGDAVWLPGFDGEVVSSEENQFVPSGLSVWEVGTSTNYKGKANRDYNKRSKDKIKRGKKSSSKSNLDRSQITFVFVTPLIWNKDDKDKWVSERNKEGIWRDVVVIDGINLVDWIEAAPAVNLWFAAEIGILPEAGVQTMDQAWEYWSYLTTPPTSEELVVVGREEQEKELMGRLLAPPCTLIIRGHSPREAWGFALAVLRRVSSDAERQSLHARTIIADNEEVASKLRHFKNLIILLKQARGQVSGFLSSRGCHVIVPEGNDAYYQQGGITLARSTHRMFAEALVGMGLKEEDAEQYTRKSGLSVTVLQRQMAHANVERPRWADGQNVVRLLPALLVGRWNDRNEADRQILCNLANTLDYGSIERQLQEFLFVDEPPLQKIGEMWTLTAPVDAFQLIARHLTVTDLDRFKGAFREVFGRIDPKVEIPPSEWIYHDIKGEQGHSGWLRSGMAEILLLIAERGQDAQIVCVSSSRIYAEGVVRGLPGLKDNWRILASLRDQYARLMEAAPSPFLDSLERLIETNPDDIPKLFVESDSFSGGHLHTGLLWGLETLAWSPDYLPQVALILAKLARLDPGGRLINRPIRSLREIFLWWHPGTNASIEQRLAVIDIMLKQEPQVGWTLLTNLLPSTAPSSSHPTAKPRWRDFGSLPEESFTRGGQLKYVSALVDRVIERVGIIPGRWEILLNTLPTISGAQRERTLALLDEITRCEIATDVKIMLWEVLKDFIYEHRRFRNAQWALPAERLDLLEQILTRISPDDPVQRNIWLFNEWLPELPSGQKSIDLLKQELEEARQQAINEVFETAGLQGLVRLGTSSKFLGWVAHFAVSLMNGLDGVLRLIELSLAAGERGDSFASLISGRAQQLYGEAWCEVVRTEAKSRDWSPVTVALLMLGWPDNRTTWEELAKSGDEINAAYWENKQVFLIDGSSEDQAYQIDQLIKAGRAVEVFDRIALHGEGIQSDILLRVFDATLEELSKAQTAEEIKSIRLTAHDVREFLCELRKREDISREEVARREYQVVSLLGPSDVQGLTLHEFMAKDPDLFVKILCDVYLPSHRDKTVEVPTTPETEARARAAYVLLEGMDTIPGQIKTDEIDEEALMQWIQAVRNKAANNDRAIVADIHIGSILAHAQIDSEDEGWPDRVIRNVVEKLATKDINRGLINERHNMRGVYSKDIYEGGKQERDLANQYRRWAEISGMRWPGMSRVLITIAERWEEYARWEDERAERDKLD